jgi:hypothetical protein
LSENKRQIFKLDEEEISGILIDYLTEEHVSDDFKYQAMSAIMGTPGEDLRYVLVLGDIKDDDFKNIDLDDVDTNTDFTNIDDGGEN